MLCYDYAIMEPPASGYQVHRVTKLFAPASRISENAAKFAVRSPGCGGTLFLNRPPIRMRELMNVFLSKVAEKLPGKAAAALGAKI